MTLTTARAPRSTRPSRGTRLWLAALLGGLVLVTACVTAPSSRLAPSSPATALTASRPYCQTALPQAWTPVGKVWLLSITFLLGNRAPQTQQSVMTFAEDGAVTATFATQPDGVDGFWCMTGPNGFAYHFKDPLLSPQGVRVGYVAVDCTAYLTDATHFVAAGKGMAYTLAGVPLAHQANLTQTQARAV
jgi:hypothetical protein